MRDQETSAVLPQGEERSASYFRDLARISSTLLAALIALMTFLLIVGVQSRVTGFTTELYTAIILLGASLVLFAVANIVKGIGAVVPLKVIRGLQQLVFIAGVVATVWFVISYAQLVVNPPTTQPGAQQEGASQAQPEAGQPAAQQGGAGGPAPGETAEQHAAESAKQPPGQAAQPQPGQ